MNNESVGFILEVPAELRMRRKQRKKEDILKTGRTTVSAAWGERISLGGAVSGSSRFAPAEVRSCFRSNPSCRSGSMPRRCGRQE